MAPGGRFNAPTTIFRPISTATISTALTIRAADTASPMNTSADRADARPDGISRTEWQLLHRHHEKNENAQAP